jgi:hypothetical protein
MGGCLNRQSPTSALQCQRARVLSDQRPAAKLGSQAAFLMATPVSDVKEKTIALFELHRETPGLPFDAEHFLDFLLADPKADRAVYNSFSGLRRFNTFIDALQLECAVCFSERDRDANYSLDEFVARVEQLQRSPRGSLASLGNRTKGGPDVNFLIIANLLLAAVAVALRQSAWGFYVPLVLMAAFDIWYANFHFKSRRYLVELRQRIGAMHGIKA